MRGPINRIPSNSSPRYAVKRRLISIGVCVTAALLVACSSQPQIPFSRTLEPLSFEAGNRYNVTDGRARFREIFCAANEDHG
ncbi:MAG: hypothetical protein VW806_13535, partial [Halieaceae bacterium]